MRKVREKKLYPPSRNTTIVRSWMKAKNISLRRDFSPDEARGEDTPSVSSREIHFATTNEGKLNEAKEFLGVEVVGTPLIIDEIQSLDPIEVATKKANFYFKLINKPVFVEDVSFGFNALKGLPGTYINDFLKVLGNEGLISLLDGKNDRSAFAQTTIVFVNHKGKGKVFIGKVKGKIVKKARGDKGFGWDPIFIPEGEKKTFAEMSMEEKNKFSMRARALEKFKEWLVKHK